ncbi:hypothetical protein CYY_004886 [Polysphondylium violaceum]|uniref:Endonuclease/exonuclease/phosphatase domain-containing protein n=1 Tax=Polysphondylium violaceum TaxID=133409 RepID=A0A8J4PUD1_9MYCE|nr:hypothetical protein CYY_004886 [Polysphondylium violaceum]
MIRISTYNIRYDAEKDQHNSWKNRKHLTIGNIVFLGASVIGLQECLHNQIEEIKSELKNKYGLNYSYVGNGRDDGKTHGEYSPILYNNDVVELIHSHMFWVSEKAYQPASRSWDAHCPRVCTWAFLRHKATGKAFYFLNTHLDHMSELARSEGTLMIKSFISTLDHGIPLCLVGDFNAHTDSTPVKNVLDTKQSSSLAHKYLKYLEIPLKDTFSFQTLYNAKSITQIKIGPDATFTGFDLAWKEDIDHVFVNSKFKVQSFVVFNNHPQNVSTKTTIASDHLPVVSDLIFN